MTVAVIGAGPVGLTLAGRLAQKGVSVRIYEAESVHRKEGSRALCMQRETLEIWNRLGIGERVAWRGVQWEVGRTYYRDRELFSVQLPSHGEHFPPFVNISQSEVEEYLITRLAELGAWVRWGHRLSGIRLDEPDRRCRLTFETDDGQVEDEADWVVGADGAHSALRHGLGVDFPGHTFEDRFLIADVRAELPFPNERRFFFDPRANPGRQVLIHPQPDGVWRVDWQVPPETDADAERRSGALDRRIREVIGGETPFEVVWVTGYRFSQRLAGRFRIGPVFLVGDAAHVMSPFGARGLNSGVADAENIAWKFALVERGEVRGVARETLLASYEAERRPVAVENLAVTDATMRFMVPHGPLRRAWRNLVLRMSPHSAWFRARVNSGRLSEPATYRASPLIEAGEEGADGADGADGTGRAPRPGAVAPDVPLRAASGERGGVREVGRLRDLLGERFVVLAVGADEETASRLGELRFDVPCSVVAHCSARGVTGVEDATGRLATTYAGDGPRAWIIRPDGHIAASRPLPRGAEGAEAAAELPRRVSAAAGELGGFARP